MTELINYLSDFVLEKRLKLLQETAQKRTNYITVVLENIFQAHNASAVLRSCDCFGIQDVHIIENEYEYNVNPDVVLGANKWLNLYKYNKAQYNSLDTINDLKSKGYRIIATSPYKDATNLEDFNLEKSKFALFFGSELPGLSDIVFENADEYLKIPMYGFTESFNISVSVAICLHHLSWKLRTSNIKWQLSENEYNNIILKWLKATIRDSDKVIDEFYKRKTNS